MPIKSKFRPLRKNTKLTGERSEAAFLNRAATLGFGVAKPWGDSLRYDFILDNGSRLWRIQVKCTEALRAQAYETRATYTTGSGRAVYTRADIDFLAAHVVPLDIWYIMPVEVCTPAPMLRFYPHRQAKLMRLEKYREAWHLLQSPSNSERVIPEIHAVADKTSHSLHSDRMPLHSDVIPTLSEAEGEEPAFFPHETNDSFRLTWLTPRPESLVVVRPAAAPKGAE
jgi:hypothetical protein